MALLNDKTGPEQNLAHGLEKNPVVLMRGHGFAAAAASVIDVVRMSIYLPRNARVLMNGLRLGNVTPLSSGEVDSRRSGGGYRPDSPETLRAWHYWAHRAGCSHLLSED